MDDLPRQPNRPGFSVLKLLMVLGIVLLLIALFLPAVRTARPAFYRNACQNNLKQIGLALWNYEKANHALPPAYTTDADGKPLHSWRTLILPYLEEEKLYKSIDLTKPWDDPINAGALKASVSAFQCPASAEHDNRTTYLAVLTPNSSFRATQPRSLSDITDDKNKTLIVIEVDSEHAVPWMSPVDADEQLVLDLGPKSKLAHTVGMNAAFLDGHVEFLDADMPAAQRRALISIAGNDNAAAEGTK